MSRSPNVALYGIVTAILLLNIGTHGLESTRSRALTDGQNYYVSPKGSNRNDGSLKHPWMTIEHAASWLLPGDTVHVLAGVYRGRIVTAASGVADARITYISEQKWKAQIIGDVIDHSSWD